MDPNMLMLAEKMAEHYQNTLKKIRLAKKKHTPDWRVLPKDVKQDMIEAFYVILGKADDIAREDAVKATNPFNPNI